MAEVAEYVDAQTCDASLRQGLGISVRHLRVSSCRASALRPVHGHCAEIATPDVSVYAQQELTALPIVVVEAAERTISTRLFKVPHQHFQLTAAWGVRSMPSRQARLQAVVADLQLYCLSAAQSAERLAKQQHQPQVDSRLNPTQKVLLNWLAKGMPEHLVAMLMGLSAAAYNHVTGELLLTLDAKTCVEAAAKATAAGYI